MFGKFLRPSQVQDSKLASQDLARQQVEDASPPFPGATEIETVRHEAAARDSSASALLVPTPVPASSRGEHDVEPTRTLATGELRSDRLVPPCKVPTGDKHLGTDGESTAPDENGLLAEPVEEEANALPRLMPMRRGRKGKRLVAPAATAGLQQHIKPEQRLLLLDTWRRSGLPAGDFASMVGVSKHTLYSWRKRFDEHGPAGLVDQVRGSKPGSRLAELTRRTILMLKESHPEWGCQRISDMLARGPALPASASAVARVLEEAGYQSVAEPTSPHAEPQRRFERARPNQLWQTDLFTFVLKRQNRRVYLVAFLDDHSRYIVSYGLHASQSTALVLEVLEAGIANYGPPEEILTDNGPQYVTWRGKSQFTRHLEKRGIRQIVAKPKRPQTLGKIERFWGTLWREVLESVIFADLSDARRRIGLFLDHYNFQRAHQGLEGLVPADRFFHAAPEVCKTLKARVAANALELARHGIARRPFYLTGQLEGKPFSMHREGERLILTREGEERQEIEWDRPSDDEARRTTLPDAAHNREVERASGALPEPLCPDGSPAAAPGEPATAPPLSPGRSALDDARLAGGVDRDQAWENGADRLDAEQGGDA